MDTLTSELMRMLDTALLTSAVAAGSSAARGAAARSGTRPGGGTRSTGAPGCGDGPSAEAVNTASFSRASEISPCALTPRALYAAVRREDFTYVRTHRWDAQALVRIGDTLVERSMLDSPCRRAHAFARIIPPDAVIDRRSAIWVWCGQDASTGSFTNHQGLSPSPLTVACARVIRAAAVDARRIRYLPQDCLWLSPGSCEATPTEGAVPCTRLEVSIVECAVTLTTQEALPLLQAALTHGASVEQMEAYAARRKRKPRQAQQRLRDLFALLPPSDRNTPAAPCE